MTGCTRAHTCRGASVFLGTYSSTKRFALYVQRSFRVFGFVQQYIKRFALCSFLRVGGGYLHSSSLASVELAYKCRHAADIAGFTPNVVHANPSWNSWRQQEGGDCRLQDLNFCVESSREVFLLRVFFPRRSSRNRAKRAWMRKLSLQSEYTTIIVLSLTR